MAHVGPAGQGAVRHTQQPFAVSEMSPEPNQSAPRADPETLHAALQLLLHVQSSDHAKLRTTLASVVQTTQLIKDRLSNVGLLPGQAVELLQTLEARVDTLAQAVDGSEAAVGTMFSSIQGRHDALLEDYERLSRTLSKVKNILVDLTSHVHDLTIPYPGISQSSHAASPFPAHLPSAGSLSAQGIDGRFHPRQLPTTNSSSSQAPSNDMPPQPHYDVHDRPEIGLYTMASDHIWLSSADHQIAAACVAHPPVAGSSSITQRLFAGPTTPFSSATCQVRFGAIDWVPNINTLRQQMYAAAFPVWEVNFALFASVDSIVFDDHDKSYVLITFLTREDAHSFVGAWYIHRVRSNDCGTAEAQIV